VTRVRRGGPNAARQEPIIDVICATDESMGEYAYQFAPFEQV
jgi:hypothetical protein